MEIPIFPLGMVAFPGERVPLHIFEPRYQALVKTCQEEAGVFGLVPVLGRKLSKHGTTMRIEQVVKRYDDGRMDIHTRGVQAFALQRIIAKPQEVEAHRALISVTPFTADADIVQREGVLKLYASFHEALQSHRMPDIDIGQELSGQLVHTVGFSTEQQAALLSVGSEAERLALIGRHLEQLIPTVRAVEQTREKVKQNGHFRALPGLEFDFDTEG